MFFCSLLFQNSDSIFFLRRFIVNFLIFKITTCILKCRQISTNATNEGTLHLHIVIKLFILYLIISKRKTCFILNISKIFF